MSCFKAKIWYLINYSCIILCICILSYLLDDLNCRLGYFRLIIFFVFKTSLLLRKFLCLFFFLSALLLSWVRVQASSNMLSFFLRLHWKGCFYWGFLCFCCNDFLLWCFDFCFTFCVFFKGYRWLQLWLSSFILFCRMILRQIIFIQIFSVHFIFWVLLEFFCLLILFGFSWYNLSKCLFNFLGCFCQDLSEAKSLILFRTFLFVFFCL